MTNTALTAGEKALTLELATIDQMEAAIRAVRDFHDCSTQGSTFYDWCLLQTSEMGILEKEGFNSILRRLGERLI